MAFREWVWLSGSGCGFQGVGVAFREWMWLSGSADVLHTLTGGHICGPSPNGEEGCLQEEKP